MPNSTPVACGNTLPQGQIVDKAGRPTWAFIKWQQDVQNRLTLGLTEIGELIGKINANTEISGRAGTIGTSLQNLDGGGVLDAVALSGTIQPPRLPQPSIGALGGVQAVDPIANSWVHAIDTSGAPQLSQPSFGNLAGMATPAQVPNLGALSGSVSAVQVPVLSALRGAVTPAQVPNLSALDGQITASQLPAIGLTGTVTLAALTGTGATGSLTFTNGIITAVVDPT